MSNLRHIALFSLFVLGAFTLTSTVKAVTTPSFPACVNPQGTLKVSYSQGTHGIVGNTGTYTGSDAVYTLSEDTLSQCFCAEDGNGIQSNWWKVTSLTQDDIQVLKNDGWFYVPNGSLWGLTQDAYMVQNSNYSCRGDTGGGDILASSTTSAPDVLGLATTGNSVTILGLATIGLFSLGVSYSLRKRS